VIDSLQLIEEATLNGAARMSDEELAGRLAELVDVIALDGLDHDRDRVHVLRELGAVCLIAGRRLEVRA
jgi:hypothetical protein